MSATLSNIHRCPQVSFLLACLTLTQPHSWNWIGFLDPCIRIGIHRVDTTHEPTGWKHCTTGLRTFSLAVPVWIFITSVPNSWAWERVGSITLTNTHWTGSSVATACGRSVAGRSQFRCLSQIHFSYSVSQESADEIVTWRARSESKIGPVSLVISHWRDKVYWKRCMNWPTGHRQSWKNAAALQMELSCTKDKIRKPTLDGENSSSRQLSETDLKHAFFPGERFMYKHTAENGPLGLTLHESV